MELQSFTVQSRETIGKGSAGRMRHEGDVPGVIYGASKENVNITVSIKELDLLLHGAQGEHALVDLTVTNNTDHNGPVILKAVQHHPVSGKALHFDFQRIDLKKKIVTTVPIKLDGRSVGVIAGGMIDHHIREIQVECLPLDTPEFVSGDISPVDIGGRLHVSDLVIPGNITVLSDSGLAVVSVHKPRVVTEVTTEDEDAEVEEGADAESTEEESAE